MILIVAGSKTSIDRFFIRTRRSGAPFELSALCVRAIEVASVFGPHSARRS